MKTLDQLKTAQELQHMLREKSVQLREHQSKSRSLAQQISKLREELEECLLG